MQNKRFFTRAGFSFWEKGFNNYCITEIGFLFYLQFMKGLILMSDFTEKYKNAVKNNFNLSREHYTDLETKYAYFVELTKRLLDEIEFPADWNPKAILDVGCGTGSSLEQLKKSFPDAALSGLDISENMIQEAQGKFPEVAFVCGDGEKLTDYYTENTFDMVIYPASLFLMPHQDESLQGAQALLKNNGIVAASILLGLKEKNQQPLELLPEFKGIIKNEDLPDLVNQIFADVKSKRIQIELDEELASTIYRIEALSAGVFPGKPYEERVQAMSELIQEAKTKNLQLVQEWLMIVGVKR